MAQASGDSEEDSAHSETVSWVQLASNIQQKFCELFEGRPWEPIDTTASCLENLEKNIGYALFGPPPQLPGDDPDTSSGYNGTQLKKIRKIHLRIVKLISNKPKIVMFLFFSIKLKQEHRTVPVIRIIEDVTPDAKLDYFIDHNGRVYKGWEDIVKNNLFPNSLLCCPKSGLYTQTDGKVEVEFIQPTSLCSSRIMLDALQLTTAIATTSVGVATLLISVPGSIVLAATIVGVASGCYGLSHSVNKLVDRNAHGQTLSLKSTDARNNWLNIIGSTTGIATGGLDAVRSVFLPGNTNCLRILSSLTIGSSAIKGLSVINSFADITNKVRITGKITPLDAYQLSASVLFFGGSVISMGSASTALQKLAQFDAQRVTDVIGTIEKVDGVIKNANRVIPKTDNKVLKQNEFDKTEKNEYREVNKVKLQNLPDMITEETEGIKIINIDQKFLGSDIHNQSLNRVNNKFTEPGQIPSDLPMLKLIKVLSSPSLKIYQIEHTALPPSENIKNDTITLLQFNEPLLENSDSSTSSSTASPGHDMKGTLRGVKNVLAAIRVLEDTKKGTYTLNTDTEIGTTEEVNNVTSKNSKCTEIHESEENDNISENNSLQNLLELAKTKQIEEEKTYQEKKNKALTYKPKLKKFLTMNRFRHRYTFENSTTDISTHGQPVTRLSDSPDGKLPSYVSNESNEKFTEN